MTRNRLRFEWIASFVARFVAAWAFGSCADGGGAPDARADADADSDTDTDADADSGVDGGETELCWQRRYPEVTDQLIQAVFVGAADDAWIAAESGGSSDSTLFHFDGASWSRHELGLAFGVAALFGSGPDDVYAVDETYSDATLAHFDGEAWAPLDPGFDAWLYTGWASAPNDVCVGGYSGVWRFDGTSWSQLFDPEAEGYGDISVYHLFGCGPGDLYAITSDADESGLRVFHYDGAAWEPQILVEDALPVGGTCAASDDAYVAANAIYHWDGSAWTDLSAAGAVPDAEWRGIYAESADSAWAVGNAGMARFDGASWSEVALEPWAWPQRIHGRPGAWAIAAGDAGSMFRVTAEAVEPVNQLITPPFAGLVGDGEEIEAISGTGALIRGDGATWERAFSWPYYGTKTYDLVAGLAPGALAPGARFLPAPYWNGSLVYAPLLVEYGATEVTVVDLGAKHLIDLWVSPSGAVMFADWDGAVLALEGDELVPLAAQPGAAAAALWGAADDDLFAWCGSEPGAYDVMVTGGGGEDEWGEVTTSIYRYDGASWSAMSAPALDEIPVDLTGTAADDIYALGRHCGVLHYDGATWTQLASPDGLARCEAIAKAGTDLFVAGGSRIWRFDGAAWAESADVSGLGLAAFVSDLWVSESGDAYAAVADDDEGAVLRYDGAAWIALPSPAGFPDVQALFGQGAAELYAASDAGEVWRYDGATWELSLSSPRDPLSLLGGAGGTVIAASDDGSALSGSAGEWIRLRDGLHCEGGLQRLVGNGPDDMLAACGDGELIELVEGRWRSVAEGVPPLPNPDYYIEGVASLLAARGEGGGYYVVYTTIETNAFDSTGESEAFLYDGAAWTSIGAFPTEEAIFVWSDGGQLFLLTGSPGGYPYYDDPRISRWDGSAWTSVPTTGLLAHGNGGAVFVGSWGDVLLAATYDLWSWDGEEMASIPLPDDLAGEVSGIFARSPDDLFIATTEGAIYRRSPCE